MSSHAAEICKKVYESINKNGDGKISFDEFKVGMWSNGLNTAEITLKQKFNNADKNKDGIIDLEMLLSQF